MRYSCILLCAVTSASLPAHSHAAFSEAYVTTTSVSNGGAPRETTQSNQDTQDFSFFSTPGDEIFGGGSSTAFAFANRTSVGVRAEATGSDFGGGGAANAGASTRIRYIFDVPSDTSRVKIYTITTNFRVTGSLSRSSSSQFNSASASWTFNASGPGATVGRGGGIDFRGTMGDLTPEDGLSVPYTFSASAGDSIDIFMQASASALAQVAELNGSASATAGFSNTFSYMGITEVRDENGDLVTDFTTISPNDSFDYQSVIPAPSSLAALGFGGLYTLRRRRS